MGTCIICGTSTDGPICEVHEEDVVFEFEGNDPSQLTQGRFYRGTVDGYADFGVFVNIGHVTGLLHRSKLDRRLESLDWEVGDEICVQVNNVRENGDIDLNRSIRQDASDFRGVLRQTPEGDETIDDAEADASDASAAEPTISTPTSSEPVAEDTERDSPAVSEQTGSADEQTGGNPSDSELADIATDSTGGEPEHDPEPESESESEPESEPNEDLERVPVENLKNHVGETVRIEGVVASIRQTSGPTVFEVRDETGAAECAAFVEAGVRAHPEIDADDVVRLDGEVETRRGEIQVETEALDALDEEKRSAVETRMDEAIEDQATPAAVDPLAADPEIDAITDEISSVATEIRRAVLESRPIVVRHDATTDGYVAGAAIERAVLPLIETEHDAADSVYHYFDRRPLEEGVYDMNDATKDVTRMLDDRDRHGEKLPLFVFAAAASTAASTDGLELLDLYDAPRVVLDGRAADTAVVDEVDSIVTAESRTAATVAATVAAAVNDDVRADLGHLPAVSYWSDTPEAYREAAIEAGVDAESATELRQAIALEAFYQSYEDKRELIVDLLFEERTGLAAQVSKQFVTKLDSELDTVVPNLEERSTNDVSVAVLDTDAYTHQYDFPPTRLLLDELARRLDTGVVVGVGTDELHVRSDVPLDLAAVVAELDAAIPTAGVTDPSSRQPKLEFLAGERDAVIDAAVDAIAEAVTVPSA
jgi:RecJ-like exonuclease